MEVVVRGVAVSGYREKLFGVVINGWKAEETAAVRALVMSYSDDKHEELLAGPDEIFISIIFGNLRGTPDTHFATYFLTLEKLLKARGFGHVALEYVPLKLL